MNIKQLDSISTLLFPKHYQPQLEKVLPKSFLEEIEQISARDRTLYALWARYTPERAHQDFEASLKGVGSATTKASIKERETMPSRSAFVEKYADLSAHYKGELVNQNQTEVFPVEVALTKRIMEALREFRSGLAAWDKSIAQAAGFPLSIIGPFQEQLTRFETPLISNLAALEGDGIGTLSLGDFCEQFIGINLRPLSEFIKEAEKSI